MVFFSQTAVMTEEICFYLYGHKTAVRIGSNTGTGNFTSQGPTHDNML